MPRNIVIFERLMYATIAFGALVAVLDAARLAALTGVGAGIAAAGSILGLAIFAGLVWLAARRRKNWARWVLLVIAIAGFFMAYPQIAAAFRSSPLIGGAHILQFLLEAIALWFVFSGDARPWFRKDTAARPLP